MSGSAAVSCRQTNAVPATRPDIFWRRGAWPRGYGRQLRLFLPAGVFFGLSYAALFEAYYRSRVSVVAPLVATESLWGVVFSVMLLRRSELVGRWLVAGAALIVAGGALIGVSR